MDLNLSQLVASTSFNAITLQEIQKLIGDGADVNLQCAGQDNNTPLHLTIINKNVSCIKSLLKYHPKLNVRNNTGETAEDIAKSVSHNEIIKLLADYRNDVFDSIDPKFIYELDENFSFQDIYELKDDENFRMLKIKECHSFKALFDKLQEEDFKEAFSETSHLFAYVINVHENNKEDFKFPVSMFHDQRPFIVITTQGDQMPILHYNNSKSKRLVKLHCDQIPQNSLVAKCKISHFIRESVIGVLEERTKEQNGDISRKLNVLCLRLKKLFRSNLDLEMFPLNETLPPDAIERLSALYDLSFLHSNLYEILMAIIESNDKEVLKTILKSDFAVCCQEEHVNTAWTSKFYDCVTELLEADSCFPNDFSLDLDEQTSEKLREIISTKDLFHDAIKDGNNNVISDLIDNNPRWKFVYDQENKSAMTVALESKQFEIYSELRSRRFSEGIDKSFYVVLRRSPRKTV